MCIYICIIILLQQYIQERERERWIYAYTWTACLHLAGMCCTQSSENWERTCGFQLVFSLSSFQSKICKARAGPLWKEWQEWLGLRPTFYVSISLHRMAEPTFLFQSATRSPALPLAPRAFAKRNLETLESRRVNLLRKTRKVWTSTSQTSAKGQ